MSITTLSKGSSKTLADFQYSDVEMANLITESMYEISFGGVQGTIEFNRWGYPPSLPLEIAQQQGRARILELHSLKSKF